MPDVAFDTDGLNTKPGGSVRRGVQSKRRTIAWVLENADKSANGIESGAGCGTLKRTLTRCGTFASIAGAAAAIGGI